MSRIVFGAARLRSRRVLRSVQTRALRARAFALLDRALELGVNAFDTAAIYELGDSERTLGEWIRERGVRDRVVVITKGGHASFGRSRVSPPQIQTDLEASLRRLGTERVDVYLVHADDPRAAVGPLVDALEAQRRSGKLLVWGVSNWQADRVEEANNYAAAVRASGVAVSSPQLSLCTWAASPWPGCHSIGGRAGREERAFYRRSRLPVLAWSPLGGGFFSGRFEAGRRPRPRSAWERACVRAYCHETNFARLARARELAERRGLSPAQIALAFVLHRELDVFAVVGASTPDRLRDDAAACGVRLDPEEQAWLEPDEGAR